MGEGCIATAQEAGHFRRILYDMPRFLRQFHLNQNISRIKFPRRGLSLSFDQLDDLLRRYEHLAEFVTIGSDEVRVSSKEVFTLFS